MGEAKVLQNKYLSKYTTAIEAAKEAVNPVTTQVETLQDSFNVGGGKNGAWYVQTVNSIQTSAQEEAILKTVLDEMAQFFDVVNDREFKQIEQKYASSRMVLIKVCEKIEEMDGTRDQMTKDLKKL